MTSTRTAAACSASDSGARTMIGQEHGSTSAPATEHPARGLACSPMPTSGGCGSPRPSPSSVRRSACWPCHWWPSSLLHANPFQVALLGTIEFLPFILFSLPAGAWVDRLRRRPILIIADIGRAVSLGSIPVAWQLGILTIEQLYVVGFVTGVLTVFFDVSYQSYLPSLLERDQILEGNSKLEISRTVAQTAGPALGGGLIGIVGAPLSIIADAISFLGSALFVGRIRRREPKPDRSPRRPRSATRRRPQGGRRGTALCAGQPLPAVDRGHDRQRQPVQQHRLLGLPGIRRADA